MAKCIPCSRVKQSEKDVIRYYKKLYEDNGIEYYVYRLEKNGGIKFVKRELFNGVFETQIKPVIVIFNAIVLI
jgi:hypothetical protein